MPAVSCSFELYVGDNTIWLGSTPILRENIWGWSETSHLSSSSTHLMRGLAAQWLLRVSQSHKEGGTIHLQTSMFSPGFEPRPYNTAVSITNFHTRWTAKHIYTKPSFSCYPNIQSYYG
ncbi:hypothetical protein TNCV_3674281 [Trichonephila clavipes]|nr:hypothetical protein TNCV_3674281 [Trichonephila clavipes]